MGTEDDSNYVQNLMNAVDLPNVEEEEKKLTESKLHSVRWAIKTAKQKQRKKDVNYISPFEETPARTFVSVDKYEVVLSVAFYHARKNSKIQEYLVVGCQPLTFLRDRLYCLSDHILDGQDYPSGFFFIEGVFYNDMRDPNAKDYSKPVIDWINKPQNKSPYCGIVSAKNMHTESFNDLNLRIGKQYLYTHQGDCEHFIVFNQVRLITKQDKQNVNDYPVHIFQSKVRRRKCVLCSNYTASYVTYGDKMAPQNPCFYCEQCYRLVHYLEDGNLLYSDYSVYPYYHE